MDCEIQVRIPRSMRLKLQLISSELGISVQDLVLEGIKDVVRKYEMFIEHRLRPTEGDKKFIESILKLVETYGHEVVLEALEHLQRKSAHEKQEFHEVPSL